jgi:hypothetical protein
MAFGSFATVRSPHEYSDMRDRCKLDQDVALHVRARLACESKANCSIVIASQRVGAKRRPMTGSAKQSMPRSKERMDCFVATLLAMTAWRAQARQIDPTGKSLPISRSRVKPQNQKYFAFPECQIRRISIAIPSRQEGRIMIVTDVGRGAVDAGSADNERRESVRRRRVVLTPRCWCQVLEKQASQG